MRARPPKEKQFRSFQTLPLLQLKKSLPNTLPFQMSALEHAFAKFSAEIVNLPEVPFGGVLQQALQAGRAAALATGKEVDFEVRGSDQELDAALCEPLIHLVRNAVDHGIETRGKVIVEIARRDDQTHNHCHG